MSGIATSSTVPNAQAFQSIIPGVEQHVAYAGTSVQSSLFQDQTSIVRLYATSDCYVAFGENPTASTSSMFLPAGVIEYFGVPPDSEWQLAVIQSSSAGTIYVTEGA